MGDYLVPETLARVAKLGPLAADAGLSIAQLALAWCLRRPEVAGVVVGATRLEQLEENVRASGVELDPELVRRIDELFPVPPAGSKA